MKSRFVRFNIYLLLLLGMMPGCETPGGKQSKETSAMRMYLEVAPDGTDRSKPVPIFRASPILVNVETQPFVDERDIEHAEVLEWMSGYFIKVQLNPHGTLMLETVTRGNPGKRIAILAQFGDETRWLGAPQLTRAIGDGILIFTPDATRLEADRIVHGLNNYAAELKKK